jgi:hypothetical protein
VSDLFSATYNPDVLSCLANLSNDEVFTPPEIVNQMLDMLPEDIWRDKNATFLDPACKSGVFLREIAKRLIEAQLPNYEQISYEINEKLRAGGELDGRDIAFQNMLESVIEHVFKNQVFGIAITELTSLLSRRSVYCSKYPQSEYSVVRFDNPEGNIDYEQMQHTWENGKCVYCGASESEYDREEGKEQYAYEFIHLDNPEEVFDMKFDVIIGNPPYQMSDGGGTGSSAKPIYQLFVERAKKLNPRYLAMIIPSRWFSGGKGLEEFRHTMLHDRRIRRIVDYENFKEVFPGVDLAGGACYFLWERDNPGKCVFTNMANGEGCDAIRDLADYDFLVRNNRALKIIETVSAHSSPRKLSDRVSSRLPFGIPTTYKDYETRESGIPCHFTQRIGIKNVHKADVIDKSNLISKWKFLVPKAPIAGQTDFTKPVAFYYDGNTRIAKPGEICSESWLVAGAFDTKEEAESFKSYLLTKTVRFLLLQTVVSQNITKKNYCFVPDLGSYEGRYTDERLLQMWGLDQSDWKLIRSKIGEIGREL